MVTRTIYVEVSPEFGPSWTGDDVWGLRLGRIYRRRPKMLRCMTIAVEIAVDEDVLFPREQVRIERI